MKLLISGVYGNTQTQNLFYSYDFDLPFEQVYQIALNILNTFLDSSVSTIIGVRQFLFQIDERLFVFTSLRKTFEISIYERVEPVIN